jgi:hypothetical protein
MNKQQTAVSWLLDNLKGQLNIDEVSNIIAQAKEMEKQKMIKFTNDWYNCYYMTHPMKTAEQYYNETYGE